MYPQQCVQLMGNNIQKRFEPEKRVSIEKLIRLDFHGNVYRDLVRTYVRTYVCMYACMHVCLYASTESSKLRDCLDHVVGAESTVL